MSTAGPVTTTAAAAPTCRYEPKVHAIYQESILRNKHGLPRMRDLPREIGGSGATLPE
jgi:hypothetical protein